VSTTTTGKQSPLYRLQSGYYGLFKTFWLWGLIGSTVLATAIAVVLLSLPNTFTFILSQVIPPIYGIIWSIGVWNAATNYTGPAIWAKLTKFYIVTVYVISFGLMLYYMMQPILTMK